MDGITWILVADSSNAKIFSAHKAKLFNKTASTDDLKLMSSHEHTESRKTHSELVSDKQGSYHLGNFSEKTDPKHHQEDLFAHELAKLLDHARTTNDFHNLILIAPPAFMGRLKKCFSHELNKVVDLTIEKNYTHHQASELVEHLREHL